MFEAVTIRPQNRYSNDPIDIGFLFECLVFYRRVYVHGNWRVLQQLIRYFGDDLLVELMRSGALEVLYEEEQLGIQSSSDQNGSVVHNPITFSAVHRKQPEQLRTTLIEYHGKAGKGRRAAVRIEPYIKANRYSSELIAGVKARFRDRNFVESGVRSILKNWVPEIPHTQPFQFSCEETAKGFVVSTDLDFANLNAYFHRRIPKEHATLTPALFLSALSDAESLAYVSAQQLSEIATDEVGSDLLKLRVSYLFDSGQKSAAIRKEFSEIVFGEARSLREAINAGTISLTELVQLVGKSNKFKGWLEKQSMDADIIREYYKEVARETFLDRLPQKIVRFGVFTLAGLATEVVVPGVGGTLAGVGLGTLDSFFLDKLVRGWRPNQFIEGEVQKAFDRPKG